MRRSRVMMVGSRCLAVEMIIRSAGSRGGEPGRKQLSASISAVSSALVSPRPSTARRTRRTGDIGRIPVRNSTGIVRFRVPVSSDFLASFHGSSCRRPRHRFRRRPSVTRVQDLGFRSGILSFFLHVCSPAKFSISAMISESSPCTHSCLFGNTSWICRSVSRKRGVSSLNSMSYCLSGSDVW